MFYSHFLTKYKKTEKKMAKNEIKIKIGDEKRMIDINISNYTN